MARRSPVSGRSGPGDDPSHVMSKVPDSLGDLILAKALRPQVENEFAPGGSAIRILTLPALSHLRFPRNSMVLIEKGSPHRVLSASSLAHVPASVPAAANGVQASGSRHPTSVSSTLVLRRTRNGCPSMFTTPPHARSTDPPPPLREPIVKIIYGEIHCK